MCLCVCVLSFLYVHCSIDYVNLCVDLFGCSFVFHMCVCLAICLVIYTCVSILSYSFPWDKDNLFMTNINVKVQPRLVKLLFYSFCTVAECKSKK